MALILNALQFIRILTNYEKGFLGEDWVIIKTLLKENKNRNLSQLFVSEDAYAYEVKEHRQSILEFRSSA